MLDDLLLYEAEIGVDATATPAVTAGVGAVPAPTVSGAAAATPAVTAGTSTIIGWAIAAPQFEQDALTLNTTAGNKSATITPRAGSLLVVVCATSSNATDPTVTDDQGGTYYKAGKSLRSGSGSAMWVFVREQLTTAAVAHVVTMTESTNNGGGLDVMEYLGFHRVGSQVVVQSANEDNIANAGGTTPAVTFGQALTSRNVVVGGLTYAQTAATGTPPSGFAERQEASYSSPAAGIEVVSADSGQTGTTVTWGGIVTAGTAYGALLVELDTRGAEPASVAGIGAVPAPTVFAPQGTATPQTVAGVGSVPAATTFADATATPSAVAGVGAVPAPTIATSATATPATVAGIGAVPAPSASGNAGDAFAHPSATAGVGAVPGPTATGGTTATAHPSAVAGVGAVPAPSVLLAPTAMPESTQGLGQILHPYAVGAGTGGGGGSTDGVNDFWAVKALG